MNYYIHLYQSKQQKFNLNILYMLYVEDENGNHIIDKNGNKISYSVTHGINKVPPYIHREMIHIDDDGHINTENRHIVLNDGINPNHAVTKGQLDVVKTQIINMIPSSDPVDPSIAENAIKELVQSSIQVALKKYHTNLIQMINKRMKGRVGKKSLTIPKTRYTWIKLLDVTEIDGITSLDEVLIQDIYIKRTDRYHNAKSKHTANAFTNLEFFYDANRENYYCYFDNHPSGWSMDCLFHYVKIPKEIAIEEEEEEEVNE